MDTIATDGVDAYVGYQGGKQECILMYSDKDRFWWVIEEEPYWKGTSQFWNVFGLGIPKDASLQSIICEINYDSERYDPRLAGAFAKSSDGIYLLHNGNIGGGRKGIGKEAFKKHYKKAFVQIFYKGNTYEFAVVANLSKGRAAQEIKQFVQEVYRIKRLVTDNTIVTFKH